MKKKSKLAQRQRLRDWRLANPMLYAYQTLKDNSKRRGKEFDITFQQFSKFCYKNKYLQGKGKSKDSYSIDRKDNEKGYTIGNIRILTLAENSKKGAKVPSYDWLTKHATVFQNDKTSNYKKNIMKKLLFIIAIPLFLSSCDSLNMMGEYGFHIEQKFKHYDRPLPYEFENEVHTLVWYHGDIIFSRYDDADKMNDSLPAFRKREAQAFVDKLKLIDKDAPGTIDMKSKAHTLSESDMEKYKSRILAPKPKPVFDSAACKFKWTNHQYTIRQRGDGKFVVVFMHLDEFRYYLWIMPLTHGEISDYGDDDDAKTFDTECEARGFLKQFFDQQAAHAAKYKLKS